MDERISRESSAYKQPDWIKCMGSSSRLPSMHTRTNTGIIIESGCLSTQKIDLSTNHVDYIVSI